MDVEIICPLYNAENYIENLDKSLKEQKDVSIKKISYVLTESKDRTEEILKENKIDYSRIKPEEFSHSLTREKVAMKSNSNILVFITQDIDIRNSDWLKKLIDPIEKGEVEACFSRQVTKYNNIEKYTREKNYPKESYIVTKNDVKTMGLKAFFFSDASSAIKTDIFKKLKGYDGKKLPISEDMYIAYKIIMNNYKIQYCAQSIVFHSHDFTLREIYERYKLTGKFLKENSYLDKYGTTGSGANLAKYVLKRILQEKKIGLLFRYPFDMGARLIGMKVGKINAEKCNCSK